MTFYAKWPPEHDEALQKHFAAGLSFAQIAAKLHGEFGASYSRNSCIGRAHRLKLSQAEKPQAKPVARREKREIMVPVRKRNGHLLPAIPREEIDIRCAEVVSRNLTIYELNDDTCKWPFGDAAPYSFCGCQTFPGFPYCAEHVALGTSPGTRSERAAHHVSTAA